MARAVSGLFAAAGLVILGLYLVVPATVAAGLYEGLLAVAIVAMLDRARRESGTARSAWVLFATGLLCWLAADLIELTAWGADRPSPSIVDALYIVGVLPMAVSLARSGSARASQLDAVSWIDGLLVAVATTVPVYVLWIEPAMNAASLDPLAQFTALAYPASDLLLLAVAVRFMLGDGRWPRSTVAFLIGVGLMLIGNAIYNVQLLADTYVTPSAVDLTWMAAFVLWGAAALQPVNARIFAPGERPWGVDLDRRSWILAFIVAMPMAVVAHAHITGRQLDATPIVLGLIVMLALTLARLRFVAHRDDRPWQGLAILSTAALLVVGAAVAITATNAAGREQRQAADRVDRLADAVLQGDGLVAWTLTIDPGLIPQVAPRLAVVRARIGQAAAALDIPEAAALRSRQQAWLSRAERQLMLATPGTDPATLRAAILEVMPQRDRLLQELQATAARYREAAATSARRGRIASVAVLATTLSVFWLLMLRFGAASRRAQAAEERSRVTRESEERMRALLGASADVITVVDETTRVIAHADQARRLLTALGDHDELHLDALLDADQAAATREALAGIAGYPGARARLEWSIRQAGGAARELEVSATDHTNDPRIGGIVLSIRDVTERRYLEAALEHQALHDPLTGLANRALITDRLAHLFAGRDTPDTIQALVMLDLDEFRAINDSFGHRLGDQLLREIARRLAEQAGPHDTLARVGGDSFAYLVEHVHSEAEARECALRMLEALDAPISLAGGIEQSISGSVGIALGDGRGDGSPQEQASLLFRDAELAMYEAKRQAQSSIEVFAPHMHDAVTQRLALRTEMALALEREEFVLHYQPIVELRTRRVVGYEALVRWEHPERGMVSPAEFIPVAEQTGLIVDLGDWVLREACRQLQAWQRDELWDDERYVAVNVAGQQLERAEFLQGVREALESVELPPRQLLIEMTESSLIKDSAASIERLAALRGLGVRLAIDDFGTGYSSLNYLHRFAVDVLKIDKSFIDDLGGEERGHALVDAIVSMARRLGLTVVAEGIEDAAQVSQLDAMRCETGQGFHFSRPLPADQVSQFRLAGAMRRAA